MDLKKIPRHLVSVSRCADNINPVIGACATCTKPEEATKRLSITAQVSPVLHLSITCITEPRRCASDSNQPKGGRTISRSMYAPCEVKHDCRLVAVAVYDRRRRPLTAD